MTLNIGRGKKILIINTKLWGEPANVDIREQELRNIIKKVPKNITTILCGDFNETDYKHVQTIVPNNFVVYDEYFERDNFATSYHEWNIHKVTEKMYREPPHHMYKNIDYFIYTDDTIVENFEVLPNENGVYMLKEPYYNESSIYTPDKWVSDHALLMFDVDFV